MQNQKAAEPPAIDWQLLLKLISPGGQQELVDFVADAKRKHGEFWLDEIKAEFPLAVTVVDLVCNHTADEAIDTLAANYKLLPVRALAGEHIRALHARLLFEIERKR